MVDTFVLIHFYLNVTNYDSGRRCLSDDVWFVWFARPKAVRTSWASHHSAACLGCMCRATTGLGPGGFLLAARLWLHKAPETTLTKAIYLNGVTMAFQGLLDTSDDESNANYNCTVNRTRNTRLGVTHHQPMIQLDVLNRQVPMLLVFSDQLLDSCFQFGLSFTGLGNGGHGVTLTMTPLS